jgi:hypothetical protein
MPHAVHRRVHFHRAASYLLQQSPQLLLIHDDKNNNSGMGRAPAQSGEHAGTKQILMEFWAFSSIVSPGAESGEWNQE